MTDIFGIAVAFFVVLVAWSKLAYWYIDCEQGNWQELYICPCGHAAHFPVLCPKCGEPIPDRKVVARFHPYYLALWGKSIEIKQVAGELRI